MMVKYVCSSLTEEQSAMEICHYFVRQRPPLICSITEKTFQRVLVACQQLASILICVQQYFSAGEGGLAWPPRLYLATNSIYSHFPIAWLTSLASKQGTANVPANRRKVAVADKSGSTLDQDFSLKLQNKNNHNNAAVAHS